MVLPARRKLNPDRHRRIRIAEEDAGESAGTVGGGVPTGDDARTRRQLGVAHEATLRAFDQLVSLVGLVLAAPLLVAIAVAVKLDSPGPVFYRQLRVGKDRRRGEPRPEDVDTCRRTGDLGGRPFVIYKFRTMHVNAEAESGPTWGAPEDDRTTRVGGILRRHRLDELPQLYNVLRGEMSIVGPRPERPAIFQELRKEIGDYPKRQAVRPGITGWAQVNRPTDQSVDDVQHKLQYDLEYVEKRSLWFDARIVLKTPLVMARPELVDGSPEERGERPEEEAGEHRQEERTGRPEPERRTATQHVSFRPEGRTPDFPAEEVERRRKAEVGV